MCGYMYPQIMTLVQVLVYDALVVNKMTILSFVFRFDLDLAFAQLCLIHKVCYILVLIVHVCRSNSRCWRRCLKYFRYDRALSLD